VTPKPPDEPPDLHPKRRAHPQQKFVSAGHKDLKAMQRAAWDAGWWPRLARSGAILWLAPDGKGQVMVHGSASDHRAGDNLRAQFRKAGLDV
jgi:hypothetical protein